MERSQNQKSPRVHDVSHAHSPLKRLKSRGEPRKKSKYRTWTGNHPPEFYDGLSKVWLTRLALREIDRRNSLLPPPKPTALVAFTPDLARFAKHGGPDLSHLRACPEPKEPRIASSRRFKPPCRSSRNRRTRTTNATSHTSKVRGSSVYDDDFEQHLMNHNIYFQLHDFRDNRSTPKPRNIAETREVLAAYRSSLSPSVMPQSVFDDFQRKNKTQSKCRIMRKVIPIIAGNANIPNEGNLPFTNLAPLTERGDVKANPDYFDGALPGEIHSQVRHELDEMIIPTNYATTPVASNFFLEATAPNGGGADVAQRQVCYDGAYGARAMHSLQNYGKKELAYDGNAYAFSSTYRDGTLKLYAHHTTAPTAEGGLPEYHMTQLNAYALTSDRETFIAGASAFRNARDLAKHHRAGFIQEANARVHRSAREDHLAGSSEIPQSGVLSLDDFVNYERSIRSQGPPLPNTQQE
ncbi:hypothetical protein F5X99DRAFT_185448 [Biscogniauxia marginata]|nr:hypothetical protein F5X99DRAFT_185448 [Biscogniauxia marginata]